MYLSLEQIGKSLDNLKSIHPFYGIIFLVGKRKNLPVGKTISFPFSRYEDELLNEFYKPNKESNFYYQPFRSPKKDQKWVLCNKYSSSSLQSIRTQSEFSKVFIHEKKSHDWGWKLNYIDLLKESLSHNLPPFKDKPIPAFDLAVWLYHKKEWTPDTKPTDILDKFFIDFLINEDERNKLFDISVTDDLLQELIFQEEKISWENLKDIIGNSPDETPVGGAALNHLELQETGPAKRFCYEPADRLNIITGDNSLGKTFLLETIWWALTGQWLEYPAQPRPDVAKTKPKINFSIRTSHGRPQHFSASYNWDKQDWTMAKTREILPGLVIYIRYDGSCAVWDSVRYSISSQTDKLKEFPAWLFFKRDELWYGLQKEEKWLCNGLIRDWVTWQTGGKYYQKNYDMFIACLQALSPSQTERLKPGSAPIRISVEDALYYPTLQMPYGDVAVVHAAAGVRRILTIAYIMVWAWHEHLANSQLIRRKPQRRLVLLIDEVEAHLHPRWQRIIVPALMNVVSHLETSLSPQLHIATHSPMVMASVETIFDEQKDDLHHLKLIEKDVVLEEIPFIKRGRVDRWLMSDVFGLSQPRSLDAETAINDAKALQLAESPSSEEINKVNSLLIKYLAPDDDFWPRWRFFSEKHGVNE